MPLLSVYCAVACRECISSLKWWQVDSGIGCEAAGGHDTGAKEVTVRDLSNAYCSIAEIYLTDAWFVSGSVT